MKIVRIATGVPQEISFDGKRFATSIFKSTVAGPLLAGATNLEGDRQADLSVHGGRDKAVYVYPEDYYRFWATELGRDDLDAAQFGENLTITGGRDTDIVIGARLAAGKAEFTVTQPRIPCHKLGARFNDKSIPQRFWNAGRLGFYLSVEKMGEICAGDEISVLSTPDHGITLRDLYRGVVDRDAVFAERALAILPAIDAGWRRRLRAVKHRPRTG